MNHGKKTSYIAIFGFIIMFIIIFSMIIIIDNRNNQNEQRNGMILMDYKIDNVTHSYILRIDKVFGNKININQATINIKTQDNIDLPHSSITRNYSIIGSYMNENSISYSIVSDEDQITKIKNITASIQFHDNDNNNRLSTNDEIIIFSTEKENDDYYSSPGYAVSIMDENKNELIYYFAIPGYEWFFI